VLDLFEQNISKMILEGDFSPRIAVAVSGGSDSVALLLLANEWAQFFGATIIALTVDHQMRDDSLSDCLFVKDLCKKHAIECHILSWHHDIIASNIQAKAREARYILLTDFCKKLDILYLCVGNHADDVVENFFLRLMRSSGIFGLSLKDVVFVNNVAILRPLLCFKKADCIKFLQSKKIHWREDITNQNHKFTRNRVRTELAFLANQDSIISTQFHLGKIADTVVRDSLLEVMANCVFISEMGYASIEFGLIDQAYQELQYLVLAHVLTIVRGTNKTPSLKSLKMIWDQLKCKDNAAANLHGCLISRYSHKVFIIRSFGKEDVSGSRLTDYVLWDKRFSIDLLLSRENLGNDYLIDRLRSSDFESAAFILSDFSAFSQTDIAGCKLLYRKFLESLPIIRDENGFIVSFPHACYYSEKGQVLKNSVKVSFTPCFVSRFVHFF
jgi:tRNA(Ile)-lysidine synthase